MESMDTPPNPLEKPGYVLEFADEFDSDGLDRTKWFPYMLPHWSTLEASAARYTVSDGSLKLLIERNQGVWLAGSDRASNVQTGHYSGAVGSADGQFPHYPARRVTAALEPLRLYTPRFGYVETRLKAVPVVGYHVALWLIGFEPDGTGEIRGFELHGGNISPARSRVDCGVLAWNDPALRDECYEDWVTINAAEYHVYALEWTPTTVSFFVDGTKLRTVKQSPQYEMQFMLGVYERPHEVLANDHETIAYPRVCEVDYVRAYQPINGYGR
jgi:hypothetical protein